jgi:Restriction endonuclease
MSIPGPLSDKNKKGDLFENVISELLSTVDGLRVVERNIDSGIEEIDLKVLNNNESGIWNQFERIIFIECKNWSSSVDSQEIRNFEGKMRNYFLHSGIFFSVNGFTGRNYKEGAFGQIKLRLNHEGFMIIPLDGTDLEEVFGTSDLSTKINEKWTDLIQ